jgi:hypothetical protein
VAEAMPAMGTLLALAQRFYAAEVAARLHVEARAAERLEEKQRAAADQVGD